MKSIPLRILVAGIPALFACCEKPQENTPGEAAASDPWVGEWQTPDFSKIRFRKGGTLCLTMDSLKVEGRYTILTDHTMEFETKGSKETLHYRFENPDKLLLGESADKLDEFRRIID